MHIWIDKKLVKDKKIKIELINISFEVFNIDRTRNGEVIRFVLLEVKVNRHKERINVAITNLNKMDMFLKYNWLVKHNLEVNWKTETI